ncbi:membrane hypothetical protein [Candidatus Sulfotelmatobacter sp. SbA7]|nr:membrane hypothetical protein [Candidatus Sulfotelmatobacter sp. SbA7]
MFAEIPAPPSPPSQRRAARSFGVVFASFLIGLVYAWFHWSRPLSLADKVAAAEFLICGTFSGVFLLTAKSVSPESNQKRLTGLFIAVAALQVIVTVIR